MDVLFEGYNDLQNDYLWLPRISQTIYGKTQVIFVQKFNNPILLCKCETTNVNTSNIVGYLQQMAATSLGIAEVAARIPLSNKTLECLILQPLVNYQVKFTLNFPVGNCRLLLWEGVPKTS